MTYLYVSVQTYLENYAVLCDGTVKEEMWKDFQVSTVIPRVEWDEETGSL
jgi:hypothetical protein